MGGIPKRETAALPPRTVSAGVLSRRPSLRISRPGDRFELEAERVANAVVSAHEPATFSLSNVPVVRLQRAPEEGRRSNEDEYMEAGSALVRAFLKTQVGKELLERVKRDKAVKGLLEAGKDFISTLAGKIVTGTAAVGVVTTLAATHRELPAQIPEIPLDFVTPGLSVRVTYTGPVDRPTMAMVSFRYVEQVGGGKRRGRPGATERARAETARLAAELARFRAGLRYPPGSPEDLRQKAEEAALRDVVTELAPGPDVDAIIAKYPWLGERPSSGPFRLTPPKLTLEPRRPPLFGERFRLRLREVEEEEDERTLQREASETAVVTAVPPLVDEVLSASGEPLDKDTRADMEARLGYDFGRVRIHTDARASESARALRARAYTVGEHVVFAAGQFAPRVASGRRLLAHELAHVVQQGVGARPRTTARPSRTNPPEARRP